MDEFNFEDLTEEELAQLMELGILDPQMGMLDKQMAQVDALRGAAPEGRDSGRIYTAANPLEHIVHAARNIQADKKTGKLVEQQQQILQEQLAGRKTFLEALRRKPPQPGLGPLPQRNVGIL